MKNNHKKEASNAIKAENKESREQRKNYFKND